MTNDPDVGSGNGGRDAAARDWSDEARKTPKEFSGVIDALVIHDLHHLFGKKTKAREWGFLALGVLIVPFAIWYVTLAMRAFGLFSGWWVLAKGWAIKLDGVVVSGQVRAAGVVVEQLSDRVAWDELHSAWLSSSAAILFTEPEERTPHHLAFDGLPLHRNFFRSEADWEDVVQLIRETVPNVRLVSG
jgi:hypothetical protein